MDHDCRFEDKVMLMGETIAKVANDVAWVKKNAEERDGIFLKHIGESDKFRAQVFRNTVWRWIFKGGFSLVFVIIVRLLWLHIK